MKKLLRFFLVALVISAFICNVTGVSALTYTTDSVEAISGVQSENIVVESGTLDLTIDNTTFNLDESGIIVKAGATLNLTLNGENNITTTNSSAAGINVEPNATLNINGEGSLNVKGGNSAAAIGGNHNQQTGTIVINSGTINATGTNGAGIGSGYNQANGYSSEECNNVNSNIIINGGNITATGTSAGSAAIGGGNHYDGGNITINAGVVNTTGNIGSGCGSSKMQRDNYSGVPYTGGVITINGGTINANAIYDSAAIGGNIYANSGIITINGGDISAIGADRGAGIGAGYMGDAESITINGGNITAIGGTKKDNDIGRGAAGIGGGGVGRVSGNRTTSFGSAANITITAGNIYAQGGYKAAGIGTGSSHTSTDVNDNYPDFTSEQLRSKSSITISGGIFEVYSDGTKNAIDYENCVTSITNTNLLTGRFIDNEGNEAGQNGLVSTSNNIISFENNGVKEKEYSLPFYQSKKDASIFKSYRGFACSVDNAGIYTLRNTNENINLYGFESDADISYRFTSNPSVYQDNIRLVDMVALNQYHVTYSDGVDNETIFEDQTTLVDEGSTTPEFNGEINRDGYVFNGWTPEVSAIVSGDVTYVATYIPVVVPAPTPEPTNPIIVPVAAPAAPIAPIIANVVNNVAPAAEVVEENATPTTDNAETVTDNVTPKSNLSGSWALINLICTALTMLAGLVILIGKHSKKEEKEDEETEMTRRRWTKVFGVIVVIVSIVVFVLTEDVTLPMVLVDKFTMVMVAITLIQVVTLVIAKKMKKENNNNEVKNA